MGRLSHRAGRSLPLLAVLAAALAASPRPPASGLAGALRGLYEARPSPGERWGGAAPEVTLRDGRRVPRELAYRDDPGFVAAAGELLRSPARDDAALGAWLLATAPATLSAAVQAPLIAALGHGEALAVFEAAGGLASHGQPAAAEPLRALLGRGEPELRAAAALALDRIAERSPGAAGRPRAREAFPGRSFQRGVSWWRRERGRDLGADTFPRLLELGVDSVALHTFDPLQRGLSEPELAAPRRPLGIPGLSELVEAAHAAGLRVMVKPHLEMRGPEPSPAERELLRGADPEARARLAERLRARRPPPEEWHNNIEMRSDADWRRWFQGYEAYLLAYAREAQAAGADLFCVGRELDRSVALRERDWRELIARVRRVFAGRLLYSANFDSYASVGFWDALDYIGVSAYFPLSERDDPSDAELAQGWQRALAPLEALSRRFGRPVLLAELGYPAQPGAARAPWRQAAAPADPALQARCYEAALSAIARRPFVHGAYAWLWEGVRQPPFRDASFTVRDKPAAAVLGAWYRGFAPGPHP